MSIINDIDQYIRENVNLFDKDTRRTVMYLKENDQDHLLAALTSKLYDKIVDKVDNIDFGTIPRSRGDITKIENYASLMECIDILRSIITEYKEDTAPIDVVSTAVENVKSRTKSFMKAYTLNVELPIVLYNTIVLAIVSSVSFLIQSCIEYIKDPGAESFAIALDKVAYNRTQHNLLFENLSAFNSACSKGDVDVAIEDVIRNNRKMSAEASIEDPNDPTNITISIKTNSDDVTANDAYMDDSEVLHDDDGVVREFDMSDLPYAPIGVLGRGLLAIAKLILPILQNLVYYFYQSRQNISDYLSIQSELIQMNAYKLQYNNDIDAKKRKSIYSKQMKIADRLRKLSNVFNIDYNKTSKAVTAMIDQDKKKYTADELNLPAPPADNGQSSLF